LLTSRGKTWSALADAESVAAFLSHIEEKGLSANTVASYRGDLEIFAGFQRSRNSSIVAAQRDDIGDFVEKLFQRGLDEWTAARRLVTLRQFFDFCLEKGFLSENPTPGVSVIGLIHKSPRFLSDDEARCVMAQPDTTKPTGIRDKAMMELMYAAGLHVSEVCKLCVSDIQTKERSLHVRSARRQRTIPVGQQTVELLESYLRRGRPQLVHDDLDAPYLFLNKRGSQINRIQVWQRVREYGRKAGLSESLTPHVLRHSFAARLIDGGANMRTAQLLLGHSHISTTELLYTPVLEERCRRAGYLKAREG
jgi:integrase/recombinase XerD